MSKIIYEKAVHTREDSFSWNSCSWKSCYFGYCVSLPNCFAKNPESHVLEFYSQRRYGVWCYRFVILPSAVSCSPGSWPLNIRYRLFYVRNAFWIGENYFIFQLYRLKNDWKHWKLLKIYFFLDKYCSDYFLIILESKIYFVIM